MRVFQVNGTAAQDLEADVSVAVRLEAQQQLIERQKRLFDANKDLALSFAKLRAEYKDDIRYLVGPETMDQNRERLDELLGRFSCAEAAFARSPAGEKEAEHHFRKLRKEKHEFYHSLKFDAARAVQIRRKYVGRAREILDRGIEPDAELPEGADPKEPAPTSNPWRWVAMPFTSQWAHIAEDNGSRGRRSRSLSASSVTGEIALWNEMNLSGADDSDWSRINIMAEVQFWFRMPAAGLVEVWIRYQDINTDYTGRLRDESGCSDADIQQLSRAYLWTSGSTERYSTIVDYRRGEHEGSWAEPGPTGPGVILSKHLFSNRSYAANEWVWVAVGIRDMNDFWVDDMSCRSTMRSQWFVDHVAIRSTGAP